MKNVMMIGLVLVFALSLATGAANAGGVPCISNSLLGRNSLKSSLKDIVYEGTNAYRGKNLGNDEYVFGLFDTSDPLDHQMIAGVSVPGYVHGFAMKDSLAYVCIYQLGLYIYDVSDVNNMIELGHIGLKFPVQDVVVYNGIAYVASEHTLYAVDVADPANLVVVDSSFESSWVYELVLHNGSIYGASTDGVFRFDLLGGGQFEPAVVVGPSSGGLGLVIENDMLYATGQSYGVFIIDISDKHNPVLLATHGTDGRMFDVSKIGDRLYVSDGDQGIVVVDVQDPANPALLGIYELSYESHGSSVDPARNIVYAIGGGAEGAMVFDVSGEPVNGVYGYQATGNGARSSVAIGSSLIVAAGGGIYTMDVTDPQSVSISSSIFPGGTSKDIAINGQTIYIAAGSEGLKVFDAFDPNALSIITTLDVPGLADSVFVENDLAYLGALTGGVSIVDILDPANPVLLSSYDTTGLIREVHVQGQYMYAAGSLGLLVFDVSDPSSPALVYEAAPGPSVVSLDVDGDRLYLGLISTGFQALDIADPSLPTLIGQYDATGRVREIEMHSGVLYYTVDNEGLYAVEIDSIGQLSERGFVTLAGQLNDIAFAGDTGYLADALGGVYMLDVTDSCSGCIADLTGDGLVNFFDISLFLQLYLAQDPIADFTNNGSWDFFDISAFLQAFTAGCP